MTAYCIGHEEFEVDLGGQKTVQMIEITILILVERQSRDLDAVLVG